MCNTKNVERLIRFVKASITEDDIVTSDFLKNEIESDYVFLVERGKISELTTEECLEVCSKLVAFYDVDLNNVRFKK